MANQHYPGVEDAVASIKKPSAPPTQGSSSGQNVVIDYNPRKLNFYEHLGRDLLIGNRVVTKGEVIEVTRKEDCTTPYFDKRADFLLEDVALRLIAKKIGRESQGPATVSVKKPSKEAVLESYGFEAATLTRKVATAERAVSNRQKAGAL
jgi:hypothetical protein